MQKFLLSILVLPFLLTGCQSITLDKGSKTQVRAQHNEYYYDASTPEISEIVETPVDGDLANEQEESLNDALIAAETEASTANAAAAVAAQ